MTEAQAAELIEIATAIKFVFVIAVMVYVVDVGRRFMK